METLNDKNCFNYLESHEFCYMCNGFYGPNFNEPVCSTCHLFLFPDDLSQEQPDVVLSCIKDDGNDSGNDCDCPQDNIRDNGSIGAGASGSVGVGAVGAGSMGVGAAGGQPPHYVRPRNIQDDEDDGEHSANSLTSDEEDSFPGPVPPPPIDIQHQNFHLNNFNRLDQLYEIPSNHNREPTVSGSVLREPRVSLQKESILPSLVSIPSNSYNIYQSNNIDCNNYNTDNGRINNILISKNSNNICMSGNGRINNYSLPGNSNNCRNNSNSLGNNSNILGNNSNSLGNNSNNLGNNSNNLGNNSNNLGNNSNNLGNNSNNLGNNSNNLGNNSNNLGNNNNNLGNNSNSLGNNNNNLGNNSNSLGNNNNNLGNNSNNLGNNSSNILFENNSHGINNFPREEENKNNLIVNNIKCDNVIHGIVGNNSMNISNDIPELNERIEELCFYNPGNKYMLISHSINNTRSGFNQNILQNRNIQCLPPEVLIGVFLYLDDLSLCSVSKVCRRWFIIIESLITSDQWKYFVRQRFPLFKSQMEITNWYNVYSKLIDNCPCYTCVQHMIQTQLPSLHKDTLWRYYRLRKEHNDLKLDPPDGIEAQPLDNERCHWMATINGPVASPYEGGIFYLYIRIPFSYPMHPPKVKFITRIFHPNVSRHGDVGIDCIQHNWSLALTLNKVLISVQSLLTDPYCLVCMEPTIGTLYESNRFKFEEYARKWTYKYARLDNVLH